MYSASGGLGGCGLLGDNGAERDEKFIFNRASIPQEGASNTLDAFDTGCVEGRALIGCRRLLGLGAVGHGGIVMQG